MDDSTNNTNVVSFTIDDRLPILNTENNTINFFYENFIETEKNNIKGYTLNEKNDIKGYALNKKIDFKIPKQHYNSYKIKQMIRKIYSKQRKKQDERETELLNMIEDGKSKVQSTIRKFSNEQKLQNPCIFDKSILDKPINDSMKLDKPINDSMKLNKPINDYMKLESTSLNTLEHESKKIVLLNFEDDTFRAVIKLPDEKINLINSWYDKSKQQFDIEDIYIDVPEIITKNDLVNILFKNIDCEHKSLFVKTYIPDIFNDILIKKKINNMEKMMSICSTPETNTNVYINKPQDITHFNIVIPKNMIYTDDYFYKNENKLVYIDRYGKSSITELNPVCSHGPTKWNKCVIYKDDELNSFDSKNNDCINKYKQDAKYTKITKSDKLGDTNITAYNAEYNVLYPPFGSNNELLNKSLNEPLEEEVQNKKLITVIINPIFFQTMVLIEPDLISLEIIHENTEYGFFELFTISYNDDNIELETFINKNYDCVFFNGAEELNNTLLFTSKFIESIQVKNDINISLTEEEKSVKTYLRDNFTISTDIDKKMKASVLYNTIVDSNLCKIDKNKMSSFRNRLSNYLKDIGLKKKRYNDGYYYYGIVEKYNNVTNWPSTYDTVEKSSTFPTPMVWNNVTRFNKPHITPTEKKNETKT